MKWKEAQKWEKKWWEVVYTNTFREEEKQLVYAEKMGLKIISTPHTPYNIDSKYNSILDIGGGLTSLLLKTINKGKCKVVDPLIGTYPLWARDRYKYANIDFESIKGEDINEFGYDEVWIYNCLQHTENPEKIIQNARKAGNIIRVFEWIDTGINVGHIHSLTENSLNQWFGGNGKVEEFKEHGCYGKGYYGIFNGVKGEDR